MPPLTKLYRSAAERPARTRQPSRNLAQSPEEARAKFASHLADFRATLEASADRAAAVCPDCRALVSVERGGHSGKYFSLHCCHGYWRTSRFVATLAEGVAAVTRGDFWTPPSELAGKLVERGLRIFMWPRAQKLERDTQALRNRLINEMSAPQQHQEAA